MTNREMTAALIRRATTHPYKMKFRNEKAEAMLEAKPFYDDDDLRRASMHEVPEAEPERKLPRGFFEAEDMDEGRMKRLIRVDDVSRLEEHKSGDSCSIWQHGHETMVSMSYERVVQQMVRHGQ